MSNDEIMSKVTEIESALVEWYGQHGMDTTSGVIEDLCHRIGAKLSDFDYVKREFAATGECAPTAVLAAQKAEPTTPAVADTGKPKPVAVKQARRALWARLPQNYRDDHSHVTTGQPVGVAKSWWGKAVVAAASAGFLSGLEPACETVLAWAQVA